MKTHLRTLIAIVALLAPAASVLAQESAAHRLLVAGMEARDKGDHQGALQLFQQAHQLDPSPMTLGQMGSMEYFLHRWDESEEHLSAAMADTTNDWVTRYRPMLVKALADVRVHVGELDVSGTPAGAQVYVNGRARGVLPLKAPLRVSEGEAAVQITAGGYQPFVGRAQVLAGGSAPLVVALEKQKVVEIPIIPPGGGKNVADGSWSHQRIAGVALMGGGVALLVAGGVLVHADRGGACDGEPGVVCDERRKTGIVGWSLVGGGAVAAGAGLALYLLAPKSDVVLGLSTSSISVGGRF